jgi:hypothetical protein
MGALLLASVGVGPNVGRASAAPAHFRRGLGLEVTAPVSVATRTVSSSTRAGSTLPGSVSLRPWAPPPGDQQMVSSCVSWAIDYTTMGYYLRRHAIDGFPLAPMYTYAQLVHGQNVGTYFEDTFAIAQAQGVDTRADYSQGDYDYKTLPTASEIANASNWKLSHYDTLALGISPTVTTNEIKSALAAGKPVVLGIPVYDNFYDLGPGHSDLNTVRGADEGGHAVTALGYDSYGVTIENSWGTSWGDGGFGRLSWRFVTHYVFAAYSVGDVVATGSSAPHIASIVPRAGRDTGGQRITITGTNFTAGATVDFGGGAGTHVVIDRGGRRLTVTTPVHSARTVTVQVHDSRGTSPTWAKTFYSFVGAPAPKALTPHTGPAHGGSHVVVTGTRLNGSSATIGGKPAKVLAATSTRLILGAPAGRRGTNGAVVLKSAGGTTKAGTFTWR